MGGGGRGEGSLTSRCALDSEPDAGAAGEERERGAREGSLSLVCEHKVVRASVLKSVVFLSFLRISTSNLASVTFPPTPL